jgi:hypothetical protein
MKPITIAMLSVSLLGAAAPLSAQYWHSPAPNSRASMERITRTINDCEDRTDDFRNSLRRALNHSRADRTRWELDLNRAADRLEQALDRTGDAWNRDRDPSKTRRYIREALDSGRDINGAMSNLRLDASTERDWSVVRSQLNLLARSFNLPEMRW